MKISIKITPLHWELIPLKAKYWQNGTLRSNNNPSYVWLCFQIEFCKL